MGLPILPRSCADDVPELSVKTPQRMAGMINEWRLLMVVFGPQIDLERTTVRRSEGGLTHEFAVRQLTLCRVIIAEESNVWESRSTRLAVR